MDFMQAAVPGSKSLIIIPSGSTSIPGEGGSQYARCRGITAKDFELAELLEGLSKRLYEAAWLGIVMLLTQAAPAQETFSASPTLTRWWTRGDTGRVAFRVRFCGGARR